MKKKNILSIFVLIGFVILGFIFLKGRTHELVKILEVDLRYVILLFILAILASFIRGHKLKILMESYNIKLKFKEWWGLQIIANWGNQLTPFKGGLSARSFYLKKKYKFPYTFSVGLIGMGYLIDFLVYGLLGIILSFFLPVSNEIKYSILIFFLMIFFGSIFMLFFSPLPIRFNIKILKYVADSINEFRRIRTNYLFTFKLGINCIVRLLISTLRFYFAFHAFGFTMSFYNCLVINIFLGLSMIISITPMNLGFRESIVVLSSKLFGVGTLLGSFVAILDRAVAIIWTFLAAPIVSYLILKDLKIKKE